MVEISITEQRLLSAVLKREERSIAERSKGRIMYWPPGEEMEVNDGCQLQVRHSSTITHQLQLEIKEDELVKDYTKVMGTGTSKRLHSATVDLALILGGLRTLSDNHSMDSKDLTAKVCFLLATCGTSRPDDLACSDASQCKVVEGVLKLVVLFPKENRGNLGLGSERISKYIQEIMELMPRDQNHPPYKARAVGVTAALVKGIPLDDVVTHGNWSLPPSLKRSTGSPDSSRTTSPQTLFPNSGSTDRVPGKEE